MLLFVGIAIAYGLISIVWTWPLMLDLANAVPSDAGDPLLNVWTLWWNSRHLPLTTAWWNAPMFYPTTDTLALCEHLAGLSPITTPIILVSGNPQLAYNIAFLLSFALSAFFAHLLSYRLTGRHDAALIAGLAFGFAPYRASQLPHLQVLASFWMPVILLGLHEYLRRRASTRSAGSGSTLSGVAGSTGSASPEPFDSAHPEPGRRMSFAQDRRVEGRSGGWLALAGVAFLLQGFSNGYYLMFLPVLLAAWMLWFLPRVADFAALAGTLTFAGLLSLPFLIKYQAVAERYGHQRPYAEIEFFSADVTAFFRSHELLAMWNWLPAARPESGIFTGATCVILVVAAVAYGFTRSYDEPRWRWLRAALATLAVVYTIVTVGTIAVGPWRTDLFGLTISAGQLDKVLTIAFGLWGAYLVVSPRFLDVWHRRSPFAFYVGATLLMWLCALGPNVRFMNQSALYRPPYWWLLSLPGFDQLRVPARFTMLATLCLAVAAGLAFTRLVSPSSRGRAAVFGLVVFGVLADGWMTDMPLAARPSATIVTTGAPAGAVMELPLGDDQTDLNAMYRGMRHDYPVVNGYCGYAPTYYGVLRTGLRQHDPSVLTALAELGTRFIIVNEPSDVGGAWSAYLTAQPGVRPVASDRGQVVYALPAPLRPPPRDTAVPVKIERVSANVGAAEVHKLTDGDLTTHWTNGRSQGGDEQVTVTLEAPQPIGGVELALGVFIGDFPSELAIDVSERGEIWTEAWKGTTAGPAVLGVLQDPRTSRVRLSFDPVLGRFVRLRQTGSDPERYWSIVELTVLGSSQ